MLWDLPVTAITPQLRNWPMMIHHVAMLVTAALSLGICSNGAPLFGYYAPFFFGASEVSTLPLVVMDVLKCHELPSPDWLGPLFAFLFLTVASSLLSLRYWQCTFGYSQRYIQGYLSKGSI